MQGSAPPPTLLNYKAGLARPGAGAGDGAERHLATGREAALAPKGQRVFSLLATNPASAAARRQIRDLATWLRLGCNCCVGVDGSGADGVVSCGMASSSPTVEPQAAVAGGRSLASRAGRAIVALALLELGLLLLVLPWAGVWQHNYFLQNWAWLHRWPLSPYVRGAVTGWGLINLWLGTGELIRLPR